MTETQKNIQNYKALLPGLKEKIMAAAMLLLVSLSMVVSASFAWITISWAPEVTGMSTTVTANGNLEIALVNPDGDRPNESAVGDSFAADGQNLVSANITWGNLVNLSDPAYGLDSIVLRPALLMGGAANLLEEPLRGANYDETGRVEAYYNEDFRFTNWIGPANGLDGYFGYSDNPQYGVRAISTVTQTFMNNDAAQFQVYLGELKTLWGTTDKAYADVIGNKTYINTLAEMIGAYMTDNMDGDANQSVDVATHMAKLYAMMQEFDHVIDGFQDTVVAMANLQLYNHVGKEEYDAMPHYDWETLSAATAAQLKANGVDMAMLQEYKTLRTNYKKVLYGDGAYAFDPKASTEEQTAAKAKFDCIEDYYLYATADSSRKVYISELRTYVNKLIDIGSTIIEQGTNSWRVSGIGGKIGLQIVGSSDPVYAKIDKGLLKEFEQLTGYRMYATNITVGAKYKGIPANITAASITTTAVVPSTYEKDESKTVEVAENNQGDVVIVAEDTYGMAVDFWVRTNAPSSYLVLEGNVLTKSEDHRAMGTDTKGNAVPLSTVTITYETEGSGGLEDMLNSSISIAVYQDEEGIWRKAEGHGTLYQVLRDVQATDEDGNPVAPDGYTISEPVFINTMTDGIDLYTVNITNNSTGSTESDVEVFCDDSGIWRRFNDPNKNAIYKIDAIQQVPYQGQTVSDPIDRLETTYTVIGYEGENRVWQENNKLDVTSTTQGSGSCYVFYADDPSQQESSLRLLSNLRVAFIDGTREDTETYGKLVALAKLDLENRYEESGKVILPLVLMEDNTTSTLTKDPGGELAILPLERNVPARITAVVFLDGRNLSNSDVLAANSIQGQLNIQFGSSATLNTIDNEALELQTRSVKVVASSTSGEFPSDNSATLNYKFDGSQALTVYVRMQVEGEQPSNASAFFMRKVNNAQGAREESFPLRDGGDGYWYGSYTFTAPGNYVLQTVQLDGMAYDLDTRSAEEKQQGNAAPPDYPKVTVEGFGLSSLSASCNGQPMSTENLNILTGAQSVSASVSVRLAASGDRLPRDVKMQFQNVDDRTLITINMTGDGTGGWSGTTNINSSGTYVLRYIIMDGRTDELDASLQKTVTIYCGIKVRITDGGTKYHNVTWEGKPYEIPVFVEVLDNNDEPIKYRTDVKLFYKKNNSATNLMDTDLTWDEARGCYVDSLKVTGAGRFTFSHVKIGDNQLYNTVETPPAYVCVSPDPAGYYDAAPMNGLVYKLSIGTGNNIQVGVRLKNADGATVTAVLYNSELKHDIATGEDGLRYVTASATGDAEVIDGVSVNTFLFDLPRNTDGYQSGEWILKELWIGNVYDGDSKFYEAKLDENGNLIRDMAMVVEGDALTGGDTPETDLHVKVVHAVFAFTGSSQSFSSDEERTLYFLDSVTVANDMKMTIEDHNGKDLDQNYVTISVPKIEYAYTLQSSDSHGGYLSDNDSNVPGFTLTGNREEGNYGTFTFDSFTLSHAGMYVGKRMTVEVSQGDVKKTFQYRSNEYTSSNDPVYSMPVYDLYTIKPTVTITDITMDGSGAYSVDLVKNGSIYDAVKSSGGCAGVGATNNYTRHADHIDKASNTQYLSSLSADGRTATIYFKCSHSKGATYSDSNFVNRDPHAYAYSNGTGVPAATIKLSGMGTKATNAKLVFTKSGGGDVIMITQYTADRSGGTYWGDYATFGTDYFEWTADNTECTRFIGVMDNGGGDNGSDSKRVAETITATTLQFTYGNNVYTFTVPVITINNPY